MPFKKSNQWRGIEDMAQVYSPAAWRYIAISCATEIALMGYSAKRPEGRGGPLVTHRALRTRRKLAGVGEKKMSFTQRQLAKQEA